MYYYKLYGMCIVSDFELAQLVMLSEEEKKLEPQIMIEEKVLPEEMRQEQECYWTIDKEKSVVSNSYFYLLIEK